ncbi:uncharacterized protein LOC121727836 [Aricia agestis]|uniref:uncharacterized protein LOC121727836 n=1 Tax=Aricia agestis TaxID=91739 RepID=UPI001C2040CA|nr:uncharacterized protein LOC121727836 [Aricia agestis]
MSLKAYQEACDRAELFGQPKPNKEEFLEKHKHLDVNEFEEIDIKMAENTAMLNEDLQDLSGGLTELNSILSSTQTKLNRLKGVCGSVTSFFRLKLNAKDNLSYSSDQSYIGQTNFDRDAVPTDLGSVNTGLGPNDNEMTVKKNTGDINSALSDLKAMEVAENTSLFGKVQKHEHERQLTSQVSKLDNMIIQAERAETSLRSQNKQMRAFLR